jgi:hypothetical protein
LFEPQQMSDMLEAAGVSIRFQFGGYDAEEPASDSPRTILVGQVG